MTTLHIIAAVLVVALAALVLWRVWNLPGVLDARASRAQALLSTDQASTALADQPASLPWVPALMTASRASGPVAVERTAADWYDPTVEQVKQTFNEFGFITSPSPAPVNPKTGKVPLTNADVCAWQGHATTQTDGTCPRCGTIVNAVQPVP